MRTCIPAIARESWSRALRAALSPPLAACRSSRARVSTFAGRAAPGSAGQGQSSRHLSHCAGSCDARGTGPGGRLRSCRRARPARLAAICPAPLLEAGKCASSRHGEERNSSWFVKLVPRRGPSGRGRGMSDLWQSFRNAIRGSEVCAAVLPPCILGAACLSALSLPRSRCHVLASRAQLALCGVRGACVHPGAYRGALMCSWSCSFCADYAHDFADGGLFHYEVCAACACTRCCGPRVCACARVQRSCRLPHACRIHPMCSHCAGGCRGLGARRAIKTRRAKRLCKQHRHR